MTPEPLRRSARPASGLYTPYGQPWRPDRERDAPHSYAYAFSVLDPAKRAWLRDLLLVGGGSAPLSLAGLERLGAPRKFAHTEQPRGLFLQAACLVTDGLDGEVRHVLARPGASPLHATCLSAFRTLDGDGHLPVALLDSLAAPNPWALLSRRLLLPAAYVAGRFVGVAFDFADPRREVVSLVWHVRTRGCPPAALVPVRDTPAREELAWRAASMADLGGEVVPWPGFERTAGSGPVPWFRDGVVLDLLRLYQQQVHRERRRPPVRPGELADDLGDYLAGVAAEAGLALDVRPDGSDAALSLVLHDEAGGGHPFRVVASVGDDERPGHDVADRCRRLAARGDAKAVFLLHAVRSDQTYRLQGAAVIGTGSVPIQVVRVALLPLPTRPEVKGVAHAVIPVRRPGGPVEGLLVTLSRDDELPRLPGGRIEDGERPAEALLRELDEELDLPASEVRSTAAIGPAGLVLDAVSPSTGRRTTYHFHPYVVALTEPGQARMRTLVGQPDRSCRVGPVSLDDFRETGLGFDPAYARAILDRAAPEALAAAAVVL